MKTNCKRCGNRMYADSTPNECYRCEGHFKKLKNKEEGIELYTFAIGSLFIYNGQTYKLIQVSAKENCLAINIDGRYYSGRKDYDQFNPFLQVLKYSE